MSLRLGGYANTGADGSVRFLNNRLRNRKPRSVGCSLPTSFEPCLLDYPQWFHTDAGASPRSSRDGNSTVSERHGCVVMCIVYSLLDIFY